MFLRKPLAAKPFMITLPLTTSEPISAQISRQKPHPPTPCTRSNPAWRLMFRPLPRLCVLPVTYVCPTLSTAGRTQLIGGSARSTRLSSSASKSGTSIALLRARSTFAPRFAASESSPSAQLSAAIPSKSSTVSSSASLKSSSFPSNPSRRTKPRFASPRSGAQASAA